MTTIVNINATVESAFSAGFPSVYSMNMMALRHKTLDPSTLSSTPIDSVEIVTQLSSGRAVLQDNGTVVVNLDGESSNARDDAFTIRVTQDATVTDCVVDLSIEAAGQLYGWGNGSINMQEVDPVTGDWIFLEGEGFKTWYIDSVDGLTIAQIAVDAGVSEAAVTGNWLISQYPTYGGSEATALAVDAATELHNDIPDRNNSVYLIKAGTDVSAEDETGLPEEFGKNGLSSIYPVIIGSYGVGEKPFYPFQKRSGVEGGFIHFEGLQFGDAQLFRMANYGPNLTINKMKMGNIETEINKIPNFTAMNTAFLDATAPAPSKGAPDWLKPFENRASGLYINASDGHAIVACLIDQAGFDAYTYNAAAEWNDGANGLPPSQYSHNVYTQYSSYNITYLDNLSFRSASQGLQVRPGGMIMNNFCAANPIGLTILGTNKPGGEVGVSNYTLSLGNLTTQGFKHDPSMKTGDGGAYPSNQTGAHNWANNYASRAMSILGDIVMNNNDPNDPLDTNPPLDHGMRRNLDPISLGGVGPVIEGSFWLNHNWDGDRKYSDTLDEQDGFINEATLNASTTVQLYADEVLGTSAGTSTVHDLINHYRGLDDLRGAAKAAYEWFAAGINAAGDVRFAVPAVRTVAQTVKAVLDPQGRTSGKWWNVSEDWDTDDYPGFIDGDSAELQGHRFVSQIPNAINLTDLSLGAGGALRVSGSSVTVSGTLSAVGEGQIGAIVAGRMIFPGYSGAEKIAVTTRAGMVINQGTVAGNMDFLIEPEEFSLDELKRDRMSMGYVMLCTGGESVTFGAGDVLEAHGYTEIAFDGPSGTATVNMNAASMLRFVARGTVSENNPYQFGVIRNKQTGVFGNNAPGITSVVNLNSTPVEIDATGMAAGVYTVMDVDQIIGNLGAITMTGPAAAIAVVGNTLQITI